MVKTVAKKTRTKKERNKSNKKKNQFDNHLKTDNFFSLNYSIVVERKKLKLFV